MQLTGGDVDVLILRSLTNSITADSLQNNQLTSSVLSIQTTGDLTIYSNMFTKRTIADSTNNCDYEDKINTTSDDLTNTYLKVWMDILYIHV